MNSKIDSAIKIMKEGGVILYPTDTIWGIGCDATNEKAVEKVYKIKQRSDSKSLILLAANFDMVCRYVKQIPDIAISLVEVNDKPMTIIYPGAMGLAKNVIAEDGRAMNVLAFYMMVGLPGSGKSTKAEQIKNEFGAQVFSSDTLRKEKFGDEKVQKDANEIFKELLNRC